MHALSEREEMEDIRELWDSRWISHSLSPFSVCDPTNVAILYKDLSVSDADRVVENISLNWFCTLKIAVIRPHEPQL